MSVNQVAGRFAKSLLDLAGEMNKTAAVKDDMQLIKDALQSRDFYLMLKSPVIYASTKIKAIEAIFGGKIDPLTMDFIRLTIKKGRENILPEMVSEFGGQYNKVMNIVDVVVRSAAALDENTKTEIINKVTSFVGNDKKVNITSEVDPSLLGGFVIQYQDLLYDGSLVYQLEKIKKSFSNN